MEEKEDDFFFFLWKQNAIPHFYEQFVAFYMMQSIQWREKKIVCYTLQITFDPCKSWKFRLCEFVIGAWIDKRAFHVAVSI